MGQVEDKLGVTLETEADKLGKLSKEQLIEMYMKNPLDLYQYKGTVHIHHIH